jgi:hypothetical protein
MSMDKTPVDTRTLEEELVDTILSGGTTEAASASAERSFVEAAVADFRAKFEDECFETWGIAQAFKIDKDHSRFLDERRVFKAQQESFRAAVSAYNREREKEKKPESKFDLPDALEHPDNCTHHDDESHEA